MQACEKPAIYGARKKHGSLPYAGTGPVAAVRQILSEATRVRSGKRVDSVVSAGMQSSIKTKKACCAAGAAQQQTGKPRRGCCARATSDCSSSTVKGDIQRRSVGADHAAAAGIRMPL